MSRTTHRLFVLLTGAVSFPFFTNLWAAVAALLGLALSFPGMLLGGFAGALLLGIVLWRTLDAGGAADPEERGRWANLVVVGGVLCAGMFLVLKVDFRHDYWCHYNITNAIVHGNLPLRHGLPPERLLPYHYGYDVLAAAVYYLVGLVRPWAHIERSLDLASLLSFAALLTAVALFLSVLNRRLPVARRFGSLDMAVVLVLVTCGGGFIFIGAVSPAGVPAWKHFTYGAMHPLLQYIGRRPTVLGQAVFCLLLTVQVLFLDPRARKVGLGAASVALQGLLALTALELLAAIYFVAALLLCFRETRAAARYFLLTALVAIPVLAVQGGLLTARSVNSTAATAQMLKLSVHFPSIPGFLEQPGPNRLAFWLFFIVEVPVTWWLLLWAARREWKARDDGARVIVSTTAVALGFFVLPMLVTVGFLVINGHRLFFLAQLISFIFFPWALRALPFSGRWRRGLLLGLPVLLSLGPLLYTHSYVAWHLRTVGRGRVPRVDTPVPAEMLDRTNLWLASTEECQPLIFHGARVLTAPDSGFWPGYFAVPAKDHEAAMQRFLLHPGKLGVTRALLTGSDYAVFTNSPVAYTVLKTIPMPYGKTLYLMSLP